MFVCPNLLSKWCSVFTRRLYSSNSTILDSSIHSFISLRIKVCFDRELSGANNKRGRTAPPPNILGVQGGGGIERYSCVFGVYTKLRMLLYMCIYANTGNEEKEIYFALFLGTSGCLKKIYELFFKLSLKGNTF